MNKLSEQRQAAIKARLLRVERGKLTELKVVTKYVRTEYLLGSYQVKIPHNFNEVDVYTVVRALNYIGITVHTHELDDGYFRFKD